MNENQAKTQPLEYWRCRRHAEKRKKELDEKMPFQHKISFDSPGVSVPTQLLHLLDPEHLIFTHKISLLGLKLGKVVEFNDENKDHPYMIFAVQGQGRTAHTRLTVLSPFDVEVHTKEEKFDTHVIFSANPVDQGNSELTASLYTNSRLIGKFLEPMARLTYWEDRPYFKAYEKRIDRVYAGDDERVEQSPFMALFRHYREHFAEKMNDLVSQFHDMLPECPMHHKPTAAIDQKPPEPAPQKRWFGL